MPPRQDSRRTQTEKRVLSLRELSAMRRRWRRQRVVFTNGVFDILHRGHVELLHRAKAAGDILIVGMNNDRSVRRLKGPSRPINRQADRAAVLAALRSVDYVCLFGADTPLRLIRELRPDILVKGAEYTIDQIVGATELQSWGGTVIRIRMRRGYSTTGLLNQTPRP